MTAKFYKNLTQNQYQGTTSATSTLKAASRESLNPVQNLQRLRERLAQTEEIAARLTTRQRYWAGHALDRVFARMWTYKFNYAIKFFFIYRAWSEWSYVNHLMNTHIMSWQIQTEKGARVAGWTGAAILTCLLI